MLRFVLMLAVVLWSCTGPAVAAESADDNTIVIGITLPRTGHLESYGLSAFYGASTCVRQINESGGINGKKLVVEWRDNGSDPARAAENVRDLVENHHVPVIIGPLMSNATIRVKHLARELGVVVLTPMASMNAIPEQDPWVFRTSTSSTAQVNALLSFAKVRMGFTRGAVIYDTRWSFSREISSVFLSLMRQYGFENMGRYNVVNDFGDVDYETPLKEIAENGANVIFAPLYVNEATELLQAAKKLGITIPFCGTATWDNEMLYYGSGTRLAGSAFCSALFEPEFNRMSREFFKAMTEVGMEEPDTAASSAYDTVYIVARALAQGTTPEQVREALLNMSEVSLAAGRFSFTPTGDSIRPTVIRFVQHHDQRLEPIFGEKYDVPRKRRSNKK